MFKYITKRRIKNEIQTLQRRDIRIYMRCYLEWCADDPNSHVIIYRGENGRTWVRPRNDFFGYTREGIRRFEKIEEN